MASPSRARRPRGAPPLVGALVAPSTPSIASPALSVHLDNLLLTDSGPNERTRDPRRTPSAHSLASTVSSAQSGAQAGRHASPLRHRKRAIEVPIQGSENSSSRNAPSAAVEDEGPDPDGISRASSSSSLDGLAARLQGARTGKGRLREEHTSVRPALNRSASSSSSARGVARRIEKRAIRAAAGAVEPPEPPEPEVAGMGDPVHTSHLRGAPGSEYDLPRQASASPLLNAASASSPSMSAAFQQSPSPSTSDDDHAEDSDPDVDKEDDLANDSALVSVMRSDAHPDPRSLLRAQLARKSSGARLEERTASSHASVNRRRPSEERPATLDSPVGELVKRRYFILSTAGKLVWTSDEDEEAATGLVGVMQAIVSIFADEGDKLRYINAGATRISFLLKAPLCLVAASSLGEPESILRVHLDYLYLQVLSVVTHAQLQAIFTKRSNFDLRRLIEGTESFFISLASSLQTSLPILLSSIEVYRLSPTVRDELSRALDPGKDAVRQLDLLYILLLCRGRLVTLLRPKKHSIHPTDLHLLLSTIYAPRPAPDTGQMTRPSPLMEPDAETWMPICLPRFNSKGFLHAYVSFFPSSSAGVTGGAAETGLVLLSSQRDAFSGVRNAAGTIRARLAVGAGQEALHALEMAAPRQAYSLGEVAVPGLRHFVYKDKALVQVTAPRWEGEYAADGGEDKEGEGEQGDSAMKARTRLTALYQHLYDALHPRPAAAGSAARPPAQVQYMRTKHEAVLGWVTPQFELYLAAAPLLPHSAVVSAARAVSRWVKREERSLFLHSAGSF